jgi:hypothetical protein
LAITQPSLSKLLFFGGEIKKFGVPTVAAPVFAAAVPELRRPAAVSND